MDSQLKLPKLFIGCIVGICILPFLLNLFGFDFASEKRPFDLDTAQDLLPHQLVDSMFYSLSGSFTHTILEWSAFCVAIMTVILAFTHFGIKRDLTTPHHWYRVILRRLHGCVPYPGRRPIDRGYGGQPQPDPFHVGNLPVVQRAHFDYGGERIDVKGSKDRQSQSYRYVQRFFRGLGLRHYSILRHQRPTSANHVSRFFNHPPVGCWPPVAFYICRTVRVSPLL